MALLCPEKSPQTCAHTVQTHAKTKKKTGTTRRFMWPHPYLERPNLRKYRTNVVRMAFLCSEKSPQTCADTAKMQSELLSCALRSHPKLAQTP